MYLILTSAMSLIKDLWSAMPHMVWSPAQCYIVKWQLYTSRTQLPSGLLFVAMHTASVVKRLFKG